MDYKFLHKVLDQIVSETSLDYDQKRVYTPFFSRRLPFFLFPHSHFVVFRKHCKDVYGLNMEEIEYVWNNYVQIIRDKIKNNGL